MKIKKLLLNSTLAALTILGTFTGFMTKAEATNVKFYLDETRNEYTEEYVRVFTNLEKPAGTRCTSGEISIYLNGVEKKGYMESFSCFDDAYSAWTNLPVNYTIGSGKEVNMVLEPGTRYEYTIKVVVENTPYSVSGSFTTPGNAVSEPIDIEENRVDEAGTTENESWWAYSEQYSESVLEESSIPNIPESIPVVSPTPVEPVMDDSFEAWCQTDARWYNLKMGSDPEALFGPYGCLVMSYNKAIISSGLRGTDYTPDKFLNDLNSVDAFYYGGYLKSFEQSVGLIVPEMEVVAYENSMVDWCKRIWDLRHSQDAHYEVILVLDGGAHYVQVDMTPPAEDTVYVNNSWYSSNKSVAVTSLPYTPTSMIILRVNNNQNNFEETTEVETTQVSTEVNQMIVRTLQPTYVVASPVSSQVEIYRIDGGKLVTVCGKIYVGGDSYFYKTADGGYINANAVELEQTTVSMPTYVTVSVVECPMRSRPNNNSRNIIGTAVLNENYLVLERVFNYKGNEWYKVYDKETCQQFFIYSGNVTF